MSQLHVYIRPFASDAGDTGFDTAIEVTKDVDLQGLGQISQSLDNTEYDVGIFRNSSVRLTLRNDHGRYSEPGEPESIFRFRRGGSLLIVTWEPGTPLKCGFFKPGRNTILSEEVELFRGLISDNTAGSSIADQTVTIDALGFESLFARMTVGASGEEPYDSIGSTDLLSEVLYAIVNQSLFTDHVTVDADNIVLGQDANVDTKEPLENKTVLEVLNQILLGSNSVLYIKDSILFVAPRTANEALAYTFYGQAALNGVENVLDIKNFRGGENRIFNFWAWEDTAILAKDDTSISQYGVFKKEVDVELVTDQAKRTTLLGALRDEFSLPKREFDLVAAFDLTRLGLFLLDKVSVDYPTVALPPDSGEVAIYGIGEYEVNRYAYSLFLLTIEATDRFKIMDRKLNLKDETISFRMRLV